jgi:hypothetical protein
VLGELLRHSHWHSLQEGTVTFPAAYMSTVSLCLRSEAGLLMLSNIGRHNNAKPNYRSRHTVAELPIRLHTVDQIPR